MGVTHIRTGGAKVSLSVSIGGDLENPSNDSIGIPLTGLPLTMDQLRDTVVDPECLLALAIPEATSTECLPPTG
jgi:hypothetical protein